MDRTDFSFMKTGFNPSGNFGDPEDFKKNIASLIVAFGENSMRTSAKYISHGPRKVITVEDLKRAMMLEVFLFSNRPDIIKKAKEIKQQIYNDESDSEDDDIDEDIADFIETDATNIFTLNSCTCPLCTCINTIHVKWDNWKPNGPYETLLQKHINNIS